MKKQCIKHPKFKGTKKPKYQCVTCYSLYLAINLKPRLQPMPTKIIKDKTKYNRKKKHKES